MLNVRRIYCGNNVRAALRRFSQPTNNLLSKYFESQNVDVKTRDFVTEFIDAQKQELVQQMEKHNQEFVQQMV